MDIVKRLWGESHLPRRIILLMLVLLFVSQFFTYNSYGGTGQLFIDADWNTTGYYTVGDPTGTGWQIHPQAYVILAILALIYVNDFSVGRFWTRFGYWLTIPLTLACAVGGYVNEPGGAMGAACVLAALVAAILSVFEARKLKPS